MVVAGVRVDDAAEDVPGQRMSLEQVDHLGVGVPGLGDLVDDVEVAGHVVELDEADHVPGRVHVVRVDENLKREIRAELQLLVEQVIPPVALEDHPPGGHRHAAVAHVQHVGAKRLLVGQELGVLAAERVHPEVLPSRQHERLATHRVVLFVPELEDLKPVFGRLF